MDMRTICGRFALLVCVMSVLAACSEARASSLFLSDLQASGNPAGQTTQPGWFAQEIAANTVLTTVPLTPTASGTSAGVAATLVSTGQWGSRGGTASDRAAVTGTSFNNVVSDLWACRAMSFTMDFTGLNTGMAYTIRTWHNDPYNNSSDPTNAGFAAGGGTVNLSAIGATVLSSTSGTVTRLFGAQTNSAFGIASISFIPTTSNAQITFTRVGGTISAVPVNGVEVTAAPVPELSAGPLPLVAAFFLSACELGIQSRRGRSRRERSVNATDDHRLDH
ncbi:MAG: hypothetical protein ACOYK7_15905 [Pirellulales bacterium]